MSLFCHIFVLFVIGTLPRKKRFLSGMAFNIYEVVNSRSLSCQSRSWFVYPPLEKGVTKKVVNNYSYGCRKGTFY